MIEITALKAFDDNYIWLIKQIGNSHCVVVDPGDEEPVIEYLEQHNLTLEAILITHKHPDHTGGVEDLVAVTGASVYGPANDGIKLPLIGLSELDQVQLPKSGLSFDVIDVPGHTLGHIAYFNGQHLFCGDTLFVAGCGRVFEGTMEQMHQSLSKLAQLPDETLIYCAHEYTQANLAFALAVEPNNQRLQEFTDQAKQFRKEQLPTVPSRIGIEKEINPFLRCDHKNVIKSASMQLNHQANDIIEVFSAIRHWKNNF